MNLSYWIWSYKDNVNHYIKATKKQINPIKDYCWKFKLMKSMLHCGVSHNTLTDDWLELQTRYCVLFRFVLLSKRRIRFEGDILGAWQRRTRFLGLDIRRVIAMVCFWFPSGLVSSSLNLHVSSTSLEFLLP